MKNRLRILRVERNWSQAELAKRLGVSRQTINALEVGKYDPSLPLAFKIARLFNTSIETIFFTEEKSMFAQSPFPSFKRPIARSKFSKFTRSAIKALELAEDESRRVGSNGAGTAQILIGLIAEDKGIAAQTLKSFGISKEVVQTEVERMFDREARHTSQESRYTPRAIRALYNSVEESFALDRYVALGHLSHYEIDTEDLLLGLLRVTDCVAVKVLENLKVNIDELRTQLLKVTPRGSAAMFAMATQEKINKSNQAAITSEYLEESTPDFITSQVSTRFSVRLFTWVETRKLGYVIGSTTGYQLADGEILTPQISFILQERLKRIPRTYPEVLPDLVVEVKSAMSRRSLLESKIKLFLQEGTRVGLLIDPDQQSVTIYRPGIEAEVIENGEIITFPELLLGWELPVSDLWLPLFE
ncbi:conserved hypothetical protein [Hyella patelloides LEGE 07179]|uniref:Transcriptional regulator n=1 Tax=Hyella patelloides LEGE 07179 TaxID=945734 RepID=A0A563VQ81_9CYAN|nr:Uma2 family endonuclease [Hyella patelloides]VEP13539.1 conserved hypothetical protein [Hyella patelloides LEGE 07179]